MADYDRIRGELHLRVLYAGPPRSGKSTSLEVICRTAAKHGRTVEAPDPRHAPPLLEHVQLELGRVFGRRAAFAHLVALPGGKVLDPTVQHLLRTVDAIVFVADATPGRAEDNARALTALETDLRREQRDLWALPLAFQWNKRDLLQRQAPERPTLCRGRVCVPSQASRGEGVVTAFQRVCLPALRAAGQEHGLAPLSSATARTRRSRDPVGAAVDATGAVGTSDDGHAGEPEDPSRTRVFARLLGRARSMFR